MIAIFQDQTQAQAFADSVQAYLKVNRPDYDAEVWADVQQHPTLQVWAVPLPPESVQVPEGADVVEALDDTWTPPPAPSVEGPTDQGTT